MADTSRYNAGMAPGSTGTLKSPTGEEIPVGPGTGEIGGERVYKGRGLGTITVWKCPSCGVENTGDLAQGCSSCGSGSAQPRHVGVPQIKRTEPEFSRVAKHAPQFVDDELENAFNQWLQQNHYDQFGREMQSILFGAWTSAVSWYRQQSQRGTETEPNMPTGMIPVPRALLDQILKQLENTIDTESGEQSPELLALISQLRELVDNGGTEQGGGTDS